MGSQAEKQQQRHSGHVARGSLGLGGRGLEEEACAGYWHVAMPKREKRLTKREKKEKFGKGPSGASQAKHIHCIACGRHIDPEEFGAASPTATIISCQHGSQFPSCSGCVTEAEARLLEHDRTGEPPKIAAAWH